MFASKIKPDAKAQGAVRAVSRLKILCPWLPPSSEDDRTTDLNQQKLSSHPGIKKEYYGPRV